MGFGRLVCDVCLKPFHTNSCGKAAQVGEDIVCLCLRHIYAIDKNAPRDDNYIHDRRDA